MLFRRILPALAAALLAGGCATPPHQGIAGWPAYVAPASGATARLLVRTIQPGTGTAVVTTFEQPVACSNRQLLERTTAAEPPRSQFTLRANRLQTLSFFYVRSDQRSCELLVSFEPKANRSYLMRNRVQADGCSVELIDATNPDQPVEEPSTLRRERVGLALAQNACRPISSTAAPSRARTDGLPQVFREALPR